MGQLLSWTSNLHHFRQEMRSDLHCYYSTAHLSLNEVKGIWCLPKERENIMTIYWNNFSVFMQHYKGKQSEHLLYLNICFKKENFTQTHTIYMHISVNFNSFNWREFTRDFNPYSKFIPTALVDFGFWIFPSVHQKENMGETHVLCLLSWRNPLEPKNYTTYFFSSGREFAECFLLGPE